MFPVSPNDVALFLTPSEAIAEDDLAAYRGLLTADELARCGRFVRPSDRNQAVVTRALVRTTLSEMHPSVGPADWRFARGRAGRPEIAREHGLDLRFNVSHARGLIALAVSKARFLGVDVERIEDTGPTLDDIAHALAPAELSRLRCVDVSRLPWALLSHWTLKEAYVKARGTGITDDLRRLEVETAPPVRVNDEDRPPLEDWQFELFAASRVHVLALAVGGEGPLGVLRLRAVRRVPLHEDQPVSLTQLDSAIPVDTA